MKKIKSLRRYFKQHRKLSFFIDMVMAVTLISLGIFLTGRTPGAFIGFFVYVLISNFFGTNLSINNPELLGSNEEENMK
ncbi:hypothetical protein AAGG74_15560 [Bacillus mexicanus]|uniref:hypothetical protein n=1 Tax=Bacillus mexicanus TaxID=2834415 RepID=UPI003D1E60FC